MDYPISPENLQQENRTRSLVGAVRRFFFTAGVRLKRLLLFAKDLLAEAVADPLSSEEADRLAAHFLNDYGNQLLRFSYSYVHNYEDAEELVTDAILKVLRVNPTFASPAHEKAYLFKVIANLSKNRIDYNKLRATDQLQEELISEEREDLSEVWDAVKRLPDKFREIIHLFYQEGYKTAEIAEILGQKEATVRSNLARGRERLKEILMEEYDFG